MSVSLNEEKPGPTVPDNSRFSVFLVFWKRLSRNPFALSGTFLFVFFLLMAVLGPVIAPYRFDEQNIPGRLKPPSSGHLFGTDQYGRDVFSRVLAGTREIFLLGGSGTLIAAMIGTTLGLLSAYYGGLLDEVTMRILDILLAFPSLLLALVLLSTVGPSTFNLILVVVILYIPMFARVIRSMVLDLKTKEFVEAAKIRGERGAYILFREILPNSLGPLLVEASMRFSYSIFLVASLGFLGLGVQPPSPDWGLQINEARGWLGSAPWTLLFPAGAVSLLVVATNLMTDGLRRIVQPGAGREGG